MVFKKRDNLRRWLDRIHAGQNDGQGREQWKTGQKSRNSGYTKNDLDLVILESAKETGLFTTDELKGSLLPIRKYTGIPIFRCALGPESGPDGQPRTDLSENNFAMLFDNFMHGLASKKAGTRDNTKTITEYAQAYVVPMGWTGRAAIATALNRRKQRWSRKFRPVVKVDRVTREDVRNDETKEPLTVV